MTKTVTLLVGVPGSGKSTWLRKNYQNLDLEAYWYSTDHQIEVLSHFYGMTYSEAFDKAFTFAEFICEHELRKCILEGRSVVFDQTNLSASKRRSRLKMFPPDWKREAFVFPTPPIEELEKRLASRPGKIIPPHIMKSMISNFTMPSKDEGFDKITIVNNQKDLFSW